MGVHVHTQPRTSSLKNTLINAIRLAEDYNFLVRPITTILERRLLPTVGKQMWHAYLEVLFENYLARSAFPSLRQGASLQLCNLRRPKSRFRIPRKRNMDFLPPTDHHSSFNTPDIKSSSEGLISTVYFPTQTERRNIQETISRLNPALLSGLKASNTVQEDGNGREISTTVSCYKYMSK